MVFWIGFVGGLIGGIVAIIILSSIGMWYSRKIVKSLLDMINQLDTIFKPFSDSSQKRNIMFSNEPVICKKCKSSNTTLLASTKNEHTYLCQCATCFFAEPYKCNDCGEVFARGYSSLKELAETHGVTII